MPAPDVMGDDRMAQQRRVLVRAARLLAAKRGKKVGPRVDGLLREYEETGNENVWRSGHWRENPELLKFATGGQVDVDTEANAGQSEEQLRFRLGELEGQRESGPGVAGYGAAAMNALGKPMRALRQIGAWAGEKGYGLVTGEKVGGRGFVDRVWNRALGDDGRGEADDDALMEDRRRKYQDNNLLDAGRWAEKGFDYAVAPMESLKRDLPEGAMKERLTKILEADFGAEFEKNHPVLQALASWATVAVPGSGGVFKLLNPTDPGRGARDFFEDPMNTFELLLGAKMPGARLNRVLGELGAVLEKVPKVGPYGKKAAAALARLNPRIRGGMPKALGGGGFFEAGPASAPDVMGGGRAGAPPPETSAGGGQGWVERPMEPEMQGPLTARQEARRRGQALGPNQRRFVQEKGPGRNRIQDPGIELSPLEQAQERAKMRRAADDVAAGSGAEVQEGAWKGLREKEYEELTRAFDDLEAQRGKPGERDAAMIYEEVEARLEERLRRRTQMRGQGRKPQPLESDATRIPGYGRDESSARAPRASERGGGEIEGYGRDYTEYDRPPGYGEGVDPALDAMQGMETGAPSARAAAPPTPAAAASAPAPSVVPDPVAPAAKVRPKTVIEAEARGLQRMVKRAKEAKQAAPVVKQLEERLEAIRQEWRAADGAEKASGGAGKAKGRKTWGKGKGKASAAPAKAPAAPAAPSVVEDVKVTPSAGGPVVNGKPKKSWGKGKGKGGGKGRPTSGGGERAPRTKRETSGGGRAPGEARKVRQAVQRAEIGGMLEAEKELQAAVKRTKKKQGPAHKAAVEALAAHQEKLAAAVEAERAARNVPEKPVRGSRSKAAKADAAAHEEARAVKSPVHTKKVRAKLEGDAKRVESQMNAVKQDLMEMKGDVASAGLAEKQRLMKLRGELRAKYRATSGAERAKVQTHLEDVDQRLADLAKDRNAAVAKRREELREHWGNLDAKLKDLRDRWRGAGRGVPEPKVAPEKKRGGGGGPEGKEGEAIERQSELEDNEYDGPGEIETFEGGGEERFGPFKEQADAVPDFMDPGKHVYSPAEQELFAINRDLRTGNRFDPRTSSYIDDEGASVFDPRAVEKLEAEKAAAYEAMRKEGRHSHLRGGDPSPKDMAALRAKMKEAWVKERRAALAEEQALRKGHLGAENDLVEHGAELARASGMGKVTLEQVETVVDDLMRLSEGTGGEPVKRKGKVGGSGRDYMQEVWEPVRKELDEKTLGMVQEAIQRRLDARAEGAPNPIEPLRERAPQGRRKEKPGFLTEDQALAALHRSRSHRKWVGKAKARAGEKQRPAVRGRGLESRQPRPKEGLEEWYRQGGQ